jgi:hypothetical protein
MFLISEIAMEQNIFLQKFKQGQLVITMAILCHYLRFLLIVMKWGLRNVL